MSCHGASGIVMVTWSLCCFTASALWPSPAVQSIFVPARRTPLQILLGSCRRPILEPLAQLHHRLRRTAQTCWKLKPLLPSRWIWCSFRTRHFPYPARGVIVFFAIRRDTTTCIGVRQVCNYVALERHPQVRTTHACAIFPLYGNHCPLQSLGTSTNKHDTFRSTINHNDYASEYIEFMH